MKLAALQQLMLAAIRHPTGVRDFLAQASVPQRQALASVLVDPPDASAMARLNVYAESYFWRLFEVLGLQYRVVAWLAGHAPFLNAMTDYVWTHPSRSPDVRRIGMAVPEFLTSHALGQRVPGIADLARVERAISLAMDAPDRPSLDRAALVQRPMETWPSMRLEPAPWVQLLHTRHSYPRLFAAREAGHAPDADDCTALVRACRQPEHPVLVWRHRLEVFHRSVGPAEARALGQLLAGRSFERICAAAAAPDAPDACGPAQVVQWLQGWLDASLLVGIDSAADSTVSGISSD